jgi:alpha-N-arabinofuranosidase
MAMGHGIYQREIDLASGKLLGPERTIWPGFEDRFCEAPHIYKINGLYYLMVAEGGTHRSHMIVVARSTAPTGPFEGCPHNPLLTHRCALDQPIEHTGHGDLFQAHDGSWWIVFLAVRTRWGRFHLGRETFLAPVTWTDDRWPVINGGRIVTLEMEAPCLPPHPWPEAPARDDFEEAALGMPWNFRRNPAPGSWTLTERPGWLRLNGNAFGLPDAEPLAWVGRRQQHLVCTALTHLEFQPTTEGEEAGLTILMNEEHHYEIALTLREGRKVVVLRKQVGDIRVETAAPWNTDGITLQISADEDLYTLSYGVEGEALTPLGTGRVRYLTQHVADGFTGVYFGLYATGSGKPARQPADFDWFEYVGKD